MHESFYFLQQFQVINTDKVIYHSAPDYARDDFQKNICKIRYLRYIIAVTNVKEKKKSFTWIFNTQDRILLKI